MQRRLVGLATVARKTVAGDQVVHVEQIEFDSIPARAALLSQSIHVSKNQPETIECRAHRFCHGGSPGGRRIEAEIVYQECNLRVSTPLDPPGRVRGCLAEVPFLRFVGIRFVLFRRRPRQALSRNPSRRSVVVGNSCLLFSRKQCVDSVSLLKLTESLTMIRRGCVWSSTGE